MRSLRSVGMLARYAAVVGPEASVSRGEMGAERGSCLAGVVRVDVEGMGGAANKGRVEEEGLVGDWWARADWARRTPRSERDSRVWSTAFPLPLVKLVATSSSLALAFSFRRNPTRDLCAVCVPILSASSPPPTTVLSESFGARSEYFLQSNSRPCLAESTSQSGVATL